MKKVLKIYNASAGSGKTYTLVKEYLRLILHPKRPETYFRKILAMTFTNKAANEMRTRIIDALQDLSTAPAEKTKKQLDLLEDYVKDFNLSPEFIEEKSEKVLRKILHRYSFFSVMTLDKFTHKIIRTFARDLKISLDFDVELDVKKLRREAVELLLDQMGRDKQMTNLMLRYSMSNLRDEKSWDFSNDLFDFSDEIFKESAISGLNKLKDLTPQDFVEIKKKLIAANALFESKIRTMAKEAKDMIDSKGLTVTDFSQKSTSVYGYFDKLISSDDFLSALTPGKNAIKTAVPDAMGGKKPDPALVAIAPLVSQYFNQIQELILTEGSLYIISKDLNKQLNNLSLLGNLNQIIDHLKEDQNILLISDFYKMISEIVQNEPVPFIYERLGVTYQHFLLDEFQDTSHLQWVNVVPLIHNSIAGEHENLIVGDGKQAIYRWRNGEVAQFVNLPEKIYNPKSIASLTDAEHQFNAAGKRENLAYNYRSSPTIVNFNNAYFTAVREELDEEEKKIYDGLEQIPKQDFDGLVEVFTRKQIEQEEELIYIHSCINKAIEKGYQHEDIAILVHSNQKGKDIAGYLSQFGIGSISPDSLWVSKSKKVQLILQVLKNHIRPKDINTKIRFIEMYGALNSSDEALALIEEYRPELKVKSLHQISEELGFVIPEFGQFLNLYELNLALIDGLKFDISQDVFLSFYLNLVFEFEKGSSNNLRAFVKWFEEFGGKKSVPAPKGQPAVQIMTIHKSKGLEFPIVILPFNGKKDRQGEMIWIEDQSDFIPAFYLKPKADLEKTAFKNQNKKEKSKVYLDMINLQYVAFTRAKNALFISGKLYGKSHQWLSTFMQNRYPDKLVEDKFTIGTLPENQSTTAPTKSLKINAHAIQFGNPEISVQEPQDLEFEEIESKKNFGNELHLLLSRIESKSGVKTALAQGIQSGEITLENEADLTQALNNLFANEKFNSYFEGLTIWNEKTILDTDGKKYIPDRIINRANETLVVDFKTGHPMKKHFSQVRKYITLLQEMGFENVNGELYYTQDLEAKGL